MENKKLYYKLFQNFILIIIMFQILLKGKVFQISKDLPSLSHINQRIYNVLLEKGQYEVISTVKENNFQSFINYLVNKETPDICLNNVIEFDQLSQEFDIMKNIIQIFRKITSKIEILTLMKKNEELKEEISKITKLVTANNDFFVLAYQVYFNNLQGSTNSTFFKDKATIYNYVKERNKYFLDLFSKQKVIQDGLSFIINTEEKTAEIFQNLTGKSGILIPYSVKHESDEYIVTSIHEKAFARSKTAQTVIFPENSKIKLFEKNSFAYTLLEKIKIPSSVVKIDEMAFFSCHKLKCVEFCENSELETIENKAFDTCQIEKISFPSSVVDLKEEWCSGLKNLTDITIFSNKNKKNIIYYDDKFILGKSDPKSDIYDILLFARRDIEKVVIPSFITQIQSYAFEFCQKMTQFEFARNSQLKSIGKCSFSYSSLETMLIPRHVSRIGTCCFSQCQKIKTIKFTEDSELVSLGNNCFFFSKIEHISIPSEITNLQDSTFMLCDNVKKVEFLNGSKLRTIGKYVFISSNIESLSIPSSVANFDELWCNQANYLTDIKVFPAKEENITYYDNKFILGKTDLKSDNFDILYFARRDIEKAVIPSSITQIASYAFDGCKQLKIVEFPKDSKLKLIGKYAFSMSSVENFTIPSSAVCFDKFSFSHCQNLKRISFCEEIKMTSLSQFCFSLSMIESICIPASITIIESQCFSQCRNLRTIEFAKNSNLKIIEKYAFNHSSIDNISIPSSVVELRDGWCGCTPHLNNIKIFNNNNNKEENIIYYDNKFILGKSDQKSDNFDILHFARRDIEKAVVPSFITGIAPSAFEYCSKLRQVEFDDKSQLKLIGRFSFNYSLIEGISFPSNVTKIEPGTFQSCQNLRIIEFADIKDSVSLKKTSLPFSKEIIVMISPMKKIIWF